MNQKLSDTEVLQQALDIAESGSWKNSMEYTAISIDGTVMLKSPMVPPHFLDTLNEVLFDHEFAQALWPEIPKGGKLSGGMQLFKWHLMNLAILPDEERIEYLRHNI